MNNNNFVGGGNLRSTMKREREAQRKENGSSHKKTRFSNLPSAWRSSFMSAYPIYSCRRTSMHKLFAYTRKYIWSHKWLSRAIPRCALALHRATPAAQTWSNQTPKWIATNSYTMISIVRSTNFNIARHARITTYPAQAGIRTWDMKGAVGASSLAYDTTWMPRMRGKRRMHVAALSNNFALAFSLKYFILPSCTYRDIIS